MLSLLCLCCSLILQDGWRGVGSATQWTARNILQPPFRACYPRSRTAADLTGSGGLSSTAHYSASDGNLLRGGGAGRTAVPGGPLSARSSVSGQDAGPGPGSEAGAAGAGMQGGETEWLPARGGWRQSGSGGNGDAWVPASHMGGALSAQQLRRRLWPWGHGGGRERGGGGGYGAGDSISYDAAASMSYAGWLPESSGAREGPDELLEGEGEEGGEEGAGNRGRGQAAGGGSGAGTSGGAAAGGSSGGGRLAEEGDDGEGESPSKLKSWSPLQGVSRWWQQRQPGTPGGAGGGASTSSPVGSPGARDGAVAAGGAPGLTGSEAPALGMLEGAAGEGAGMGMAGASVAAASVSVGGGVAGSGMQAHVVAAGRVVGTQSLGSGTVQVGAASWLLRGMFAVCTARRPQARSRAPAGADEDGGGGVPGVGGDSEDVLGNGGGVGLGLGAQRSGLAHEGGAAGRGEEGDGGAEEGTLLGAGEDDLEDPAIQEDLTAVVAALAGEGGEADDGEEGEGSFLRSRRRTGHAEGEEDEGDGDGEGEAGSGAEEQALLRQIGDDGAAAIALDSMPGGLTLPLSPAGPGGAANAIASTSGGVGGGRAGGSRSAGGSGAEVGAGAGAGLSQMPRKAARTSAGGGPSGDGGAARGGSLDDLRRRGAGMGETGAGSGTSGAGHGLAAGFGANGGGEEASASGTGDRDDHSSPAGGVGGGGGAGGSGAAAPKRLLYPPGRLLHLLPAARISGPTGPLPSRSPPPRVPLGTAPPGIAPAALADSVSRHTPVPPGLRPTAAELASSRVAFYETPHVLLEVPDNEVYGRVKLCRTMVLDHLMPAYLTALSSVMAQLEAQVQWHQAQAGADLHRGSSGHAEGQPMGAGVPMSQGLQATHHGVHASRTDAGAAQAPGDLHLGSTGSAAAAGAASLPAARAVGAAHLRQRPIVLADGDLL